MSLQIVVRRLAYGDYYLRRQWGSSLGRHLDGYEVQ